MEISKNKIMGEYMEMNEKAEIKRKRKGKNQKRGYVLNREQSKYFIDLSRDIEQLRLVQETLLKANDKSHGEEITMKEIALYGISRLGDKDIEKLQEGSLSKRELLERAWLEYKRKTKLSLSFEDFLLKKVGIN